MATVSIPHSWNQSARRWRSSVKVPNVRTGSEARSGPTAATCIFAPTSMARGWMGDIARDGTGFFCPVMPASPCVANRGRGWTAQDINFLTGITARRHHSQVRNNPWTTFFYGIIRHQKFVGRSPPPSDPTAGPFLWPQADRRSARVFLEVDDRLGALQALLEPGVFPLCLGQLSRQRIGFARFRAAPGRSQGAEGAGFALAAPVGQGR